MIKITFYGRICSPLTLKSKEGEESTHYLKFRVVSNAVKDKPVFLNATAFNRQAETIAKYCQKGDLIILNGDLESNEYQEKKYEYIKIRSFTFCDNRKKDYDFVK